MKKVDSQKVAIGIGMMGVILVLSIIVAVTLVG